MFTRQLLLRGGYHLVDLQYRLQQYYVELVADVLHLHTTAWEGGGVMLVSGEGIVSVNKYAHLEAGIYAKETIANFKCVSVVHAGLVKLCFCVVFFCYSAVPISGVLHIKIDVASGCECQY